MKRFISLGIITVLLFILTGCSYSSSEISPAFFTESQTDTGTAGYSYADDYSFKYLNRTFDFLYHDICFVTEDIIPDDSYAFTASAAACYSINDGRVIYASGIFDKVYPASITKLMTAYLCIRYANMEDVAYISEDNCGITTAGAQLCGFKAGDSITVQDLLYCLLVYSGNDAAVAIAEHVSGSTQDFVRLMNSTAEELGAIDSHFTNPHGLNEPNHYTTAYDMYLVFNACLKYESLVSVLSTQGHDVTITHADGTVDTLYMEPTNLYFTGQYTAPAGLYVVGGKTGSTIAAGNCLILYSVNDSNEGFITELFGCADKKTLYNEMNELLDMCGAD